MTITPEMPVRDIAVQWPAAIPILEDLRIDYCCRGDHSLAEACAELDLAVASVITEIESDREQRDSSDCVWKTANVAQLVDHIVEKHHAATREHLHLIQDLMTKVERRHGATHPEVFEVSTAMAAMGPELESHLSYEEGVVFPTIRQLERSEDLESALDSTKFETHIARVTADHDRLGRQLLLLRETTDGYQPPMDACTTFRALYRALEVLDSDLQRHIQMENNVLFPRVLALAKMEL